MRALFILIAFTFSTIAWAGGNADVPFEGTLMLTATGSSKTPQKIKLTVKGANVLIDAKASNKEAPLLILNTKTAQNPLS